MRFLLILAGLALVLASCGGGDDGSDDLGGEGGTQADSGSGDDSNDSGGDSNGDSGGDSMVPEIDPSAMPPPGEARIEVDGQVFNLSSSEMEHYTCEIRDDGVSINYQIDAQSPLFLQGASQPDGSTIASVTVRLEDEGVRYDSTTGAGRPGGVATDGSQLIYVGEFDVSPLDDPVDISAVGEGTIYVTCS